MNILSSVPSVSVVSHGIEGLQGVDRIYSSGNGGLRTERD